MDKKKQVFFMANALLTSKLSYCKRRQVGVVLVKDNRILVNGYNGTITGTPNQCEYPILECPNCKTSINITSLINMGVVYTSSNGIMSFICPHCRTKHKISKEHFSDLESNPKTDHTIVVHAEQNAIVWAAKMGIAIEGATIFVTDAPCGQCAKLIVQSGIKEVYYMREYRTKEGIELFKRINYPHYKINEEDVSNYLKGAVNV